MWHNIYNYLNSKGIKLFPPYGGDTVNRGDLRVAHWQLSQFLHLMDFNLNLKRNYILIINYILFNNNALAAIQNLFIYN